MKQTNISELTIQHEKILSELLINILILRRDSRQLIRCQEYDSYLYQSLGFTIRSLLLVPGDEFICFLKESKCFTVRDLEIFSDMLFHISEDLDEQVKSKVKERCSLIYKYVDEEDRKF